jgi:hypothetical protein
MAWLYSSATWLTAALFATGSFNVYVKNLGRWSRGLEYRYLGREPLSADDRRPSSGTSIACKASRLQGVPDVHVHPLEPLAVRQTVSKTF